MENIDNNYYWDRIRGYPTELQIDARWNLRDRISDKAYGSLRIVSHPDLPPGHLRAHIWLVKDVSPKTKTDILRMLNDYNMSDIELEVYSIKDSYDVEYQTFVDVKRKLEELFNVKIFE